MVLANLETLRKEALVTKPPTQPIDELTIAVCTRERAESLRRCLERLRLSVDNRHEILVIDNAPETKETELVVESFATDGMRIRRVVENARGLSRARNRALEETTTKYLAYTDDDALPDCGWTDGLLRGFSRGSNVAVVTGIVPPAHIETRAQELFQQKVKWSRSLAPETYSMRQQKEHPYPFPFPFSAGHFGTGANFAVDRKAIRDLGGFDEALGAGTRTQGGEDMEMFVRSLRRGFELVYEPSAIVWHVHRREEHALRSLLFGYGKGLSAAAVSEFLHPGKIAMVRGTLKGAVNLAKERRTEAEHGAPHGYFLMEVAGILVGPFAYITERYRGPKSL